MAVDTGQLIRAVSSELRELADPAYRELVRTRYNMNVDDFWGVRTPAIHRVAGKYYKQVKALSVDDRFEICDEFLATGIYELKILAFRWAHLARREYEEGHLDVFARWLDEHVDDWIDCDDLCIHVIGEYFLKHPGRADQVVSWTRSANEWTRRGAAVSLVLPARRGQQLHLAFVVAGHLLTDDRPLVRKAYGWLLKEASKTYPNEVLEFVVRNRDSMPRESLRYAVEKLPEELRRQALQREE